MAKKQARRRRTGYTVGPAPIRRRKMNGARRKSTRRRGRMHGVSAGIQTNAMNVLQMAVGAIGGGMLIGLAERITPNYYVRAGGTAVVGLMLGRYMPKAKMVGLGIATAGVVGIGTKLLNNAGITPGALNGRRTISKEQMKALHDKLKAAGRRSINAADQDGTLNKVRTLNAYAQQGNAVVG